MTRPASSVWAILPIKSLDSAKYRLKNVLSPDERRALMLNSSKDVLAALTRSSRLSGVLLVSKDPTVLELGRKYGVRSLIVESDNGHSDAINQAVELLGRKGVAATLTIPADAPLLTAEDIDIVCDSLSTKPSLTIVSNSDGTGTNCIGASPPDLIPYQFGSDSFSRHVSLARDAGIEPTILHLPRLELDIDTQSDIAALMKNQTRTATQKFLLASEFGVAR